MEFAKHRRRRRRNGAAGKVMAAVAMAALIIYLVTASAAGTWLAQNVMEPAFSALSNIELFNGGALDALEGETAGEDALTVSLDGARSATTQSIEVPAVTCFALQMGVFSSESNARAQAEALRGQGAGGYVYQDGDRYRVLAAAYSAEAEAKSVRDRLTKEGADCTLFTIASPAVTFSVTAGEAQLADIERGFCALSAARDALSEACIAYDSEGMSPAQGAEKVMRISAALKEDCAALDEYAGRSSAIAAVAGRRDAFAAELDSLCELSGDDSAAFAAQMKHSLLALSDAYAKLLNELG